MHAFNLPWPHATAPRVYVTRQHRRPPAEVPIPTHAASSGQRGDPTRDPPGRPAPGPTAAAALRHPWFAEAPLPVPLTRSEIRQLRRNREDAINSNSGAHNQALLQQRAAVARRVLWRVLALFALSLPIRDRSG